MKTTNYLKSMVWHWVTAVLYVAFWPLICHAKKFYHEGRYLTSYGKDRITERKRFEESTIVSSRAQISEVCSEATFQPLLQLYLLLPVLMTYDYSKLLKKSVTEFADEVPELQFWSIVTSCLALAWSFSSYQATKKNGALDFDSNLAGRLVLLLSCICQISARLVILVIFAYTCGPGNFWPLMAGCFVHTLFVSLIHWATKNDSRTTNDELFWKNGQVAYQCLINGISDLYVFTSILPRETKDNSNKNEDHEAEDSAVRKCLKEGYMAVKYACLCKRKENKKFKMERDVKRMLVDMLICTENVGILLGAYLRPKELGIPTEFLVAVLTIHIAGLLLMVF